MPIAPLLVSEVTHETQLSRDRRPRSPAESNQRHYETHNGRAYVHWHELAHHTSEGKAGSAEVVHKPWYADCRILLSEKSGGQDFAYA